MAEGEYRTYAGWISVGRAVCAGERAGYYFTNRERSVTRAAFSFAQTEPYSDDLDRLPELIPASEREPAKKDPRPLVKVDFNPETYRVAVWVGPNKEAIKQLKESETPWMYNAATHRWTAEREDIHRVRRGLEVHNRVELKINGKLWEES